MDLWKLVFIIICDSLSFLKQCCSHLSVHGSHLESFWKQIARLIPQITLILRGLAWGLKFCVSNKSAWCWYCWATDHFEEQVFTNPMMWFWGSHLPWKESCESHPPEITQQSCYPESRPLDFSFCLSYVRMPPHEWVRITSYHTSTSYSS